MAKQLHLKTKAEIKAEMSIAGSPDKVAELMGEMSAMMGDNLDFTNPAELMNMRFVIEKMDADLKFWLRRLGKRNGQKYV